MGTYEVAGAHRENGTQPKFSWPSSRLDGLDAVLDPAQPWVPSWWTKTLANINSWNSVVVNDSSLSVFLSKPGHFWEWQEGAINNCATTAGVSQDVWSPPHLSQSIWAQWSSSNVPLVCRHLAVRLEQSYVRKPNPGSDSSIKGQVSLEGESSSQSQWAPWKQEPWLTYPHVPSISCPELEKASAQETSRKNESTFCAVFPDSKM